MQNVGEQQLQSAVKPCCCCAGSLSFWLVPLVSMRCVCWDRQTDSSTCWGVIQGVGFNLLEPLSEQSLCKSKSGGSALVTWNYPKGMWALSSWERWSGLDHSDVEIWLHPSVRRLLCPPWTEGPSGQPEHFGLCCRSQVRELGMLWCVMVAPPKPIKSVVKARCGFAHWDRAAGVRCEGTGSSRTSWVRKSPQGFSQSSGSSYPVQETA